MQSAMEKSVGKNETYYTASTGHPFALGTAPDHINSHRQPWNTWKHWFQRVPESKWNRAKTTINHQKLSEKCLLTSLQTVVQSIHESPRPSSLADNRPQSPNTAVCLLERSTMGDPPQNRTQWFTRRNTGDTSTVGRLSFSLCYFVTPLLSPFTEKPGISPPSHS